jgi:hypothetical protein
VVAEEDRPLALRRNLRRARHDLDDRQAILLPERHVHARHERKVEGHVALVVVAEVRTHVGRPLIRLGEEDPVVELRVERGAHLLQHDVRLGEVLAVRPRALDEVGNRVEPQTVDAEPQPETHHIGDRLEHAGIVEVQVGLVAEEAMPVELLRFRIPAPVRLLGVGEDDARVAVELRVVRPDVEVAFGRSLLRAARTLEPGVLVRRVVDDQLRDDSDPELVRAIEEALEVVDRAIQRIDRLVLRDVVAVVPER